MRTVGDILSAAKTPFVGLCPDDPVLTAINLMATNNLGALAILDGGRLVGIFSERDFARKVLIKDRLPQTTPLREVMTTKVLTVDSDTSSEECLSLMNRAGVRNIPVVEEDRVLGVLSILEVVNAVLAERESMINHLEQYVSETWPL